MYFGHAERASPALAVLGLVGLVFVNGAVEIVRWATFLAVLLCFVSAFSQRTGDILRSPALLLAAITVTFYSLVPYVINVTIVIPMYDDLMAQQLMKVWLPTYFGGDAEALVVGFASALLIVHHMASSASRPVPPAPLPLPAWIDRAILAGVVMLSAALPVVTTLTGGEGFVYSQLWVFYPPVQSVFLISLIHLHKTRESPRVLILGLAVIACIAPLAIYGMGKIPLFMFVTAAAYFLSFGVPNIKSVAIALVLGGLVFISVIPMGAAIHKQSAVRTEAANRYTEVLQYLVIKLYARQTETGYCLHNIMDKHLNEQFELSRQTFWLAGLIPRALWPEKPNLSYGGDYAMPYCGVSPHKGHSASITLLGQPIIEGGKGSLLLNGGLLILFLGSMTYAARRSSGFGAIVIAALLPWWIDFDQDFVLYVANLVKFGLAMAVIIVVMRVIARALPDR